MPGVEEGSAVWESISRYRRGSTRVILGTGNAVPGLLHRTYLAVMRRPKTESLIVIVIIDNYDSFTYNLVQRLGEIGLSHAELKHEIVVYRNDEVTVDQVGDAKPTHIIISPGPCTPREGGISNDVIKHFHTDVPIFGVCLGHQCMGHVFGATIDRAERLMHGKTSQVHHDGRTIFATMSNPFTATRYHSLTIVRETLSEDFEVSAWTDQDEIMAIRHRILPLEGVQFHPESFLTTEGTTLLANFLRL